VLKKLSI